jgi:hypothetical protein
MPCCLGAAITFTSTVHGLHAFDVCGSPAATKSTTTYKSFTSQGQLNPQPFRYYTRQIPTGQQEEEALSTGEVCVFTSHCPKRKCHSNTSSSGSDNDSKHKLCKSSNSRLVASCTPCPRAESQECICLRNVSTLATALILQGFDVRSLSINT